MVAASAAVARARFCRALAAFADDDDAGCVRMLGPVLGEVVRIGGSHAQRELIEDTFIVAHDDEVHDSVGARKLNNHTNAATAINSEGLPFPDQARGGVNELEFIHE